MIEPHCKLSSYHETNSHCPECELDTDQYGNTEEDFVNCSFPDCGCDGERLCMARNGASERSRCCNVEGMYQRSDPEAQAAKLAMISFCVNRKDKPI